MIESEELFVRMFAVQHRVLVDLQAIGAFEEWSPLEVLVMRIFAVTEHALGIQDIASELGCSLSHASRLAKKLKERGLVSEFRWHQTRSWRLTLAGEEWMRRELENLTAFTANVFGNLTPEERAQLFELLGRVRRSAS